LIRLEPNALYSRADLAELLKPLGIDADGFISRLKPIKRFRMAWWGTDLIQAIEKVSPLKERAEDKRSADRPHTENGRTRRGRKPRFEKLDGYLEELKGGADR